MSDRIVGIDLGTSNSVVAFVDELDRVRVIGDADGVTVHPSVVSFHPNGGVVVGVGGKQRKVIDPANTIYSAKRMIGQPFRSHAVSETARRVPFEIREGANELPMVVTRAGEFAIPEISAIVLDHMRKIASQAIGQDIGRAVVTVPASFTDVQRSSTATAGALAGLTVVRVLNEPTAAALAYGATKKLDEIIAVYDFGGGTFDITILKLEDQVYTVLGTSGDAFLGGEDMDERIVERMVDLVLESHRVDLRTDDVAMMRLRAVAEHTKIELSRRSRAIVKIEEIAFGPSGAIDLEMHLTRDELVASVSDLVDRTFASCKEAMVLAGIRADRISDIILVGGTTQIPYVRDQVGRFFRMVPRTDLNPDDAIAIGAGIQASSIEQMLARTPVRGGASIHIPVDDLVEDTAALDEIPVEVEPEPVLSKIAEVKRPKRGTDMFSGRPRTPTAMPKARRRAASSANPLKIADRAKDFFGDLFGDKPAGTQPIARVTSAQPAPEPPRRSRSMPVAPPIARQPEVSAPPLLDLDPIEEALDADALEYISQLESEVRVDDFLDEPKVEPPSEKSLEIDWEQPPDWPPPEAAAPSKREPSQARKPPRESSQISLAKPTPLKKFVPQLDWEPPPAATRTAVGMAVAEPAPDPWAAAPVPARDQSVSRAAAVIDVTPRSLGIATVAGYCEELIRRNAQLPAGVRKAFVTSRDRQDTVRIVVCQGESRRLENNILIGDLVLPNLPARPRGETQIDVEFLLDASGILHVTARDSATGAEQRARLDLKGAMPQEDLAVAQQRLQQLATVKP